eukprot:1242475-Amphidinium_carterae.1
MMSFLACLRSVEQELSWILLVPSTSLVYGFLAMLCMNTAAVGQQLQSKCMSPQYVPSMSSAAAP